ncbi:MAG: transcription-repair coupling factor [Calditrichaeota bacterium]|nr:MAG: transcription-repair coupling factor [Calditrichota bacterium]
MSHQEHFKLPEKLASKVAILKSSTEGWLPFFCSQNNRIVVAVENYGNFEETQAELESFGLKVQNSPKFHSETEVKVFTWQELFEEIPLFEDLEELNLNIKINETQDQEVLLDYLVEIGYTRTSMVEIEGEFSVRGNILDVFPKDSELPIRIEIDFDEVIRISTFDVTNQTSLETQNEISVPAIFVGELEKKPRIEQLDKNAKILFKSGLSLPEILESVSEKFAKKDVRIPVAKLKELLKPFQLIVESLTEKPEIDFRLKPAKSFKGNFETARKEFLNFSKVHLYCENRYYKERFLEQFHDCNNVVYYEKGLKQGFEILASNELVVTNFEILGKRVRIASHKKISPAVALKKLEAMEFGEIVVHSDYGIGIYEGLVKLKMGDTEKECLKIAYEGSDYVYVTIEKFNKIQKYTGHSPDSVPKISKLHTREWVRTKAKVQKKLEEIAEELIRVEAERKISKGFAFPPDNDLQNQMEATFEYEETEDQLTVISEIKKDMESIIPMERLLCGDVGYGKTEVALRAAFKAVCGGKQVAILVPTTVLANQHYLTFKKRLETFPVEVRLMARTRTKQEQKETLGLMKNGKVDIVIGTHRLLSKDIEFGNLGLLIIDEEHRFGVKHKERLKSYQNKVDILMMTATPIPRTMHQTLVGIKDISNINTPPKDRLPVHTEIKIYNPQSIAEAIRFELERGGQVFFLHNRVKSIYSISEQLKELVPEGKFIVGHGQMSGTQLEKVMFDFLDHKYDVLIATTIIESGLDIANANTLIVHNAQNLGLAELYQLRGRVGRSTRQAFAYLVVPSLIGIQEKSRRRLRVIEEFQHLGAGLEVAMKDMELRGAGNILGVQQSGFVKDVGFELYLQMLEEELLRRKAIAEDREPEIKIETTVNCTAISYLPESYVDVPQLRFEFYRKLSDAKEELEVHEIAEELRDRFGQLPSQAESLMSVILVKVCAQKAGFDKVNLNDKQVTAYLKEGFWTKEELNEGIALDFVQKAKAKGIHFKYLSGDKFGVLLHLTKGTWKEKFEKVQEFLKIFWKEKTN